MTSTFSNPRNSPFFKKKYSPWIDTSTYSGCDIIPVVYGLDAETKKPSLFAIGDISTLTYSIHRDKGAVRTLGRANSKGFVRGSRTIAGTLVFNVFDRRALWEISKDRSPISKRVSLADNLPGFDIVLYFSNEYGNESTLVIYNVQIVDEGQSHSVQDLYIENTMSYIAQDIDLMEPVGEVSNQAVFLGADRMGEQKSALPDGKQIDYSYLKVG